VSFLRKSINNEEEDEDDQLEEQYQKLFPKIGRDFVHIDDLKKILESVRPGLGYEYGVSEARRRAREYKALLDSGKSKSGKYDDLIDLGGD
jgi:hypothetical protein